MDVPNKVLFFVFVSVLQLAISNVIAVDYLVGDESGWTINHDYRVWAKDKIFRVGDRLVFKYTAGAHNVMKVKRDAFKNCMANPRSEALNSGNDVIELTKPGRKWYISSVGDQCSVGNQKLAITVFPLSSNYFNRKSYFIPSTAPAPIPNYEFIWKLLFPPSAAPAPGYNFPWKMFFPPSVAPAPGYNFPWKMFFPPSAAPAPAPANDFPWWNVFFPPSSAPAPAPSFDFPWNVFFPPSPAPAPTSNFPWKWLFPQTPAPAPTTEFPWRWLFPPFTAPASSPTMDFQEEAVVSSEDSI